MSTSTPNSPLFQSLFSSLPSAVHILLALTLLLLSLFLLIFGTRSLLWGRYWGRSIGIKEKKGYIPGGVGGIVGGGLVFGYISTMMTMFIESKMGKSTLSGGSLLAILILPTPIGMYLGSRRNWCARASFALLGSLSLTLLLTLSIKLSLTPRLILFLILLVLSLLLVLLPYYTTRLSISLFTSFTSSLLLIFSLDLFLKLGFIDSLGLMVSTYGVGTTGAMSKGMEWNVVEGIAGKGLLAAWWLLGFMGAVAQGWWNWRDGGEGDETWNDYLSTYSQSSPSPYGGTFFPPESIFSRFTSIFKRSSSAPARPKAPLTSLPKKKRRANPWDDIEKGHRAGGEKSDTWNSETELSDVDADDEEEEEESRVGLGMELGRRKSIALGRPARYEISKMEVDEMSDDDERDEEEEKGLMSLVGEGRNVRFGGDSKEGKEGSEGGLSGSTLVTGKPKMEGKEEQEGEEEKDLLATLPSLGSFPNKKGKGLGKKSFLKTLLPTTDCPKPASFASTSSSTSLRTTSSSPTPLSPLSPTSPLSPVSSRPSVYPNTTPVPSYTSQLSQSPPFPSPVSLPSLGPVPSAAPSSDNIVPATPSLIHAIQRVQEAQRAARMRAGSPRELPSDRRRGSMDEWWKKVQEKGKEGGK